MNLTPRNLSLRARLVIGVVILAAVGFTASGIAAQSALHSFLINQVDNEISGVVGGNFQRLIDAGIESDDIGQPRHHENDGDEDDRPAPGPLRRLPSSTSLTLLDAQGEIVGQLGGETNSQSINKYIAGITPGQAGIKEGVPYTLDAEGNDFRVIVRTLPNASGSVVVGKSLDSVDSILHRLQALLLFISALALLLIALLSRTVIKIGLKPLVGVEETAEKIAAGDLSARMPDSKPGTEVGRLVSSLNAMLGRIESSFAARTTSENKLRRFVADASHELRTPLTAIRGFAELHRQGAVQGEDKVKEVMQRIESESKRMGDLVEDLLLLARMDQSREMEAKPVNISELIIDAVESARAAGPLHPIKVSMPQDEIYILGDNNRIHQVVANLLANARTHTPDGTSITVTLSQSNDGTSISVADNGPGLSEEDQKKIFERFYRADKSRQRTSSEGSGLGLSIVDAVMSAHNGTVTVDSAPGEGATFTLFFPTKVE